MSSSLPSQQAVSTQSPQGYTPPPGPAPRKWLMDRIQGQSKYGERGERPPCPCCWVPPPVGWCPALLETNFFCKCWGAFGISNSESARFWCLNLAFLLNLCAMLLTAYSCLAISEDFFVLSKASFHELRRTEVNGALSETIVMFVGLRAAALENPVADVGQVVVHFDQFCDLAGEGIERYMDADDCNACQNVSTNMVIALMISVATFLPTFVSEQLRMYSGYDVNCVKAYLTILGVVTLLLNISVIVSFLIVCFPSFYGGAVSFDREGNILLSTPQENEIAVNFDWTWGYGLTILVAATGAKALDVFLNACVPTPNVTRDRREQDVYESIGMKDLQNITGQAPPPGGSSVSTRETPRTLPNEQQTRSSVAQQAANSMAQSQSMQQQSMLQSQQDEEAHEDYYEVEEVIEEEDYGQSGNPSDPSVVYSAQHRNASVNREEEESLQGDASLAYPSGPSLAPYA
ncbi:hypothetical protein IV203_019168 [Nitzschia inconspicua]|uniref:Transmembrane protein n=1 Tax=Nitzschia inconspicua TaxID=303405 RepID=A0A9K3LXW7_9STRA|nr:hypothetical protein IV203_019168 [Nitzschia inconspicua]